MNKDDVIHDFISDVKKVITPNIQILSAIAEILKTKK